MARKKASRRRMRGRYLKGNVDEGLALGTLGSNVLVGVLFDDSVTERTRVSSVVATYSMSEFTQATGDGPIMVGLAHGDYTDAEVEEFIEQTGSWAEANLVGREVANRKVRILGTFPSAAGAGVASEAVALNEGRPIKTKLNWVLTTGQTLRLWAYNLGASALATTDPAVRAQGHANLWVL